VFLGTHPTGFYADLARAEVEKLKSQPQMASLSPPERIPAASGREVASKEALEWDKVKDSADPAALQKFIKRFPDSPLAINAQQRMDVLKKAAQDREDKARADREAAQRAAEEARLQAEQKKAEQAAAKKREDDERRARDAEAAEKAKAAAAELAVQKKREDDERRAAAAEADRQARAAEAERKAAEAERKAAETQQKTQAEKEKAVAEAVAARAASEKQAREAEAARKQAELAAAAKEVVCKTEQGKLDALIAKGSEGSGVDDLKSFSRIVTCERLGPLVVASLDRFNAESAKRAASLPNSPELVRSAQTQLVRLGCMSGKIDGTLNAPTKSALAHYLTIGGQPSDNASVTEALVTELTKHATRVCPIECKSGETLKGETCVADEKPAAPATASRNKNDDNGDEKPARKKQADREPEARRPPKPAPEAPRARQQALARPSIVSGGGGGGGSHTMIGVGF
jgi:hypothetical protein